MTEILKKQKQIIDTLQDAGVEYHVIKRIESYLWDLSGLTIDEMVKMQNETIEIFKQKFAK